MPNHSPQVKQSSLKERLNNRYNTSSRLMTPPPPPPPPPIVQHMNSLGMINEIRLILSMHTELNKGDKNIGKIVNNIISV